MSYIKLSLTAITVFIVSLTSVSNAYCAPGVFYEYDHFDRLVKVTRPGGSITYEAWFDDNFNKLISLNEYRYPTIYYYESFGDPMATRLLKIESTTDNMNPVGSISHTVSGTTTYNYNAAGKVVKAEITGEDINSNIKTVIHLYGYNAKQFLETETHPEMNTVGGVSIRYIHDNVGNVLYKTNARGTTGYTYDNINRIKTIDYPGDTPDVTYTYDRDLLWKASSTLPPENTAIEYIYVYWPDNRLHTKSYSIKGKGYHEVFHYNEMGNLSSITYPSSRVITYNYHPDQVRVESISDSLLNRVLISNIAYHPSGQVLGYSYSNGIRTEIAFDPYQRVESIKAGTQENAGTIVNLFYEYSGCDNLMRITDYNKPVAENTGNPMRFVYDWHSRMIMSYGTQGQSYYSYDYQNNITQINGFSLSSGQTYKADYAYENNKLTNIETTFMGSSPSHFPITTDETGNITKKGSMTLAYDATNRITHVNGNRQYWNDPNGNRIIKTHNGKTTCYHYGPDGNVISESSDSHPDFVDYIYLGRKILVKCRKRGES